MANPPVYGVCGYPLAQSLSPLLHNWALKRAGLLGNYTAWETPPEDLRAFVAAVRDRHIDGVSLTIPHKERVIPMLDGVTGTAEAAGAVNTLYWEDDALLGHNTDIEGFLAPLSGRNAEQNGKAPPPLPDSALVLGAGGAARAAMVGLARLGVPRITVAARDERKADSLLATLYAERGNSNLAAIAWDLRTEPQALIASPPGTLLVVNTTPLGMRGKAEGESPLPASALQGFRSAIPTCLAYDLVYNPLQTPFLAEAARAGWTCFDGLDMFVTQAQAQFHLWTKQRFDIAEARNLLAKNLEG